MVEEATLGELDLPLGVGSTELDTIAGGKVVLEVAGVEVGAVELLVRPEAGGQQAEQDDSATHHCHHHCHWNFHCLLLVFNTFHKHASGATRRP